VERVLLAGAAQPLGGAAPACAASFPLSVEPAGRGRARRGARAWSALTRTPYCPGGAAERLYAKPLELPFRLAGPAPGTSTPEAGYGPWPAVERWCLDSAEHGLQDPV